MMKIRIQELDLWGWMKDDEEEEGEAEQEEGQMESQEKVGPNQVPIDQLFKKNVKGQGNKVPDIAKALKPPKTNRERVRYQYTYRTENGEVVGEEPKKSIVIKKKDDHHGPKDLIEFLTRQKKQLWDREQNMKLLREQDEKEWAQLVEECDHSSDDDEEEENFAWYDMDNDNTYFTLTTSTKNVFKKDDQLFICYGRTSN